MPVIMEKNDERWIPLVGNIFKFEKEGEEISGKLVSIRQGTYNNKIYDIDTGSGLVIVFGTKAIDAKISQEFLGKFIKIFYKGWAKSSTGRRYRVFDVFYKVTWNRLHLRKREREK